MQKDKQERYLELLAGLRLMDDDFFSDMSMDSSAI